MRPRIGAVAAGGGGNTNVLTDSPFTLNCAWLGRGCRSLVTGSAVSYKTAMKSWLERSAAVVCALVCAFTGVMPAFVMRGPRDAIVERRLDTNGDGRPDVVEYYRDGALLRRDTDRNFNGVTDLVEDFDEVTQEPVRSVVDQDYDGVADVQLLYRHGQAVVSERASCPARGCIDSRRRSSTSALVSLRNPFAGTLALDSVDPLPQEPWLGPVAAAGLLASAASVAAPAPCLITPGRSLHSIRNASRSIPSPRGPPRV